MLDRGYIDYEGFVELTRRGVYFVSRLKQGAVFEGVEECKVPDRGPIVRDRVIFFPSQAEPSAEYFFRLEAQKEHPARRLPFSRKLYATKSRLWYTSIFVTN